MRSTSARVFKCTPHRGTVTRPEMTPPLSSPIGCRCEALASFLQTPWPCRPRHTPRDGAQVQGARAAALYPGPASLHPEDKAEHEHAESQQEESAQGVWCSSLPIPKAQALAPSLVRSREPTCRVHRQPRVSACPQQGESRVATSGCPPCRPQEGGGGPPCQPHLRRGQAEAEVHTKDTGLPNAERCTEPGPPQAGRATAGRVPGTA